mgnify:FL=1
MSKKTKPKPLTLLAPPPDLATNDQAYADWLHSHAPQVLERLFEDIATLSVEERVKYNMQLMSLITTHKPTIQRKTDSDTMAKLAILLK